MINHKGTQRLETERLILRRYIMDDAEDMYANWVTDREATCFWGWETHENIQETRRLVQGWIEEYEKPDYYHWIIQSKESSEAVGYIFLSEFNPPGRCAAVRYLLCRKLWGQGNMTEACGRVLAFAFDELGLEKVKSRHHELNPASGRVLEKCGFGFVNREYMRFENCPRIDGEYLFYEVCAGGALD